MPQFSFFNVGRKTSASAMLLPKYGGRKGVGEEELNKDVEESIEIEANLSTCESSSRSASYDDILMTSSSEARSDAEDIERVEDNDERDDIDEHSDQEEMSLIDDVVRRVTERIVSNGGVLTMDNFVIACPDKDPMSEERDMVEKVEDTCIEEIVLPFSGTVTRVAEHIKNDENITEIGPVSPGEYKRPVDDVVNYECLAVVKVEEDGFANAIKEVPTVDCVTDGCNNVVDSINFSGQTMHNHIQAQAINTIRGLLKTVGHDNLRGLIECVDPLLVSTFSDDSQQGKIRNPNFHILCFAPILLFFNHSRQFAATRHRLFKTSQ
jgi:hypothetical protein